MELTDGDSAADTLACARDHDDLVRQQPRRDLIRRTRSSHVAIGVSSSFSSSFDGGALGDGVGGEIRYTRAGPVDNGGRGCRRRACIMKSMFTGAAEDMFRIAYACHWRPPRSVTFFVGPRTLGSLTNCARQSHAVHIRLLHAVQNCQSAEVGMQQGTDKSGAARYHAGSSPVGTSFHRAPRDWLT